MRSLADEDAGATAAEPTPDTARTQFIWPVAGWIAANTHYRSSRGVCDADGAPHWTGSADVAVPLMSDVAAARAGRVVDVGLRDRSGFYVEIAHGNDVHTYYSHFARQPSVTLGQSVTTGQIIGVSGQTGHSTHSHLHFGIFIGGPYAGGRGSGARALIPQPSGGEIQCGDWVQRGDFIPGDYGLVALDSGVVSSFSVTVTSAELDVRASASSTSALLGTLARGTVVSVVGSSRGWYEVAFGSGHGYIAHSGTRPSDTSVFGVTVSSAAPVLREGPGVPGTSCVSDGGCAPIPTKNPDGTPNHLPAAGDLMAVFEIRPDSTGRTWYEVLYEKTFVDPVDGALWSQRYAWISSADVRRSVRTIAEVANVREGPACAARLVGTAAKETLLTATSGELDERSPPVEWLRFLYAGTGDEEWTSSENTVDANPFEARLQGDVPVRSCASSTCASLGRLGAGTWVVALEESNGWYRIDHDGRTGWIVGWYTQGRAAGL